MERAHAGMLAGLTTCRGRQWLTTFTLPARECVVYHFDVYVYALLRLFF
jgi:hypothetical protein